MRGMRILNNALSKIVNAERRGTATTQLHPVSNVMADFLGVMKKRGYIKDFEVVDMHRVGKITVQLAGRLKDCRSLTYRQSIKAKDIQEFKQRKLPTQQWGYIVVRTPEGIVDHEEAIKLNIGGQILGYFY
ncbi:putative 30S ribosomal protein S8 [Zostera marina]|uniref:Small ribosomal subunit protein uS8c n=1 Tax=Zostera marina TaxID=29655 RepID=A0A0K9P4Y1_ZOSMR|nr:putative 30S ribosomal protein S8 [Zostera marina]